MKAIMCLEGFFTNHCDYTMFAMMAWLEFFFNLYKLEMLEHRKFILSGSIFNLPPYAERIIHANSLLLC